jgi:acyl-CoA thioester hydrolase
MKRTEMPYRVPYADTDKMGVVYYANYLVLFERVRNELLREAGFPYAEFEARGLMLPVVEANCRYHAPAAYDDLLTVSGWFAESRGPRLTIRCEVRRDGVLLASGHTVHACVDLRTRRPVRPPPELVALAQPGSEHPPGAAPAGRES